ncbi:MAG: hypothetical protein RL410_620, partial [Actinomycetota bacterium]
SYGELKFTSFEWKINERDPNNSFTVDMKYSPLPGVKMTKQLAVFNDVNGYMVPTEETVNLAQTGVGTAYFDDIPDANLTGVSTSAIGANVNLSTAVVQSDGPTTLSMSHIAPRASLYKGASVALYSRLYNSKSKKYASWKKVKTVKLSTSGKASFKVKFAGQTQYQVRSSSLTLGAKIKTVKVKKK